MKEPAVRHAFVQLVSMSEYNYSEEYPTSIKHGATNHLNCRYFE